MSVNLTHHPSDALILEKVSVRFSLTFNDFIFLPSSRKVAKIFNDFIFLQFVWTTDLKSEIVRCLAPLNWGQYPTLSYMNVDNVASEQCNVVSIDKNTCSFAHIPNDRCTFLHRKKYRHAPLTKQILVLLSNESSYLYPVVAKSNSLYTFDDMWQN
jgi:hypothetical protein